MVIKLAENLQMLRKQKKLTQEELAEVFGVTGQSVSKWELGLSCPDITLLPEIAEYFKVSIDELIGYKPMTSLNSLYLNMKSLVGSEEENEMYTKKQELVYKITLLASTLLDDHEKDYARYVLEGKPHGAVTVTQSTGGITFKGNNTIFMSNFRDFPKYDNNTIRKLHKYLTSINKINTLRVLFAIFKLTIENENMESYTMQELVEKTGFSENDIWLAFNDLNIQVRYKEDGIESWYLGCLNEVPMFISLLTQNMINWNPEEKGI